MDQLTEQIPPKYKVWTSTRGTEYANTEQEAWDLIGLGSLGELYEVRHFLTNELVDEFIPF